LKTPTPSSIVYSNQSFNGPDKTPANILIKPAKEANSISLKLLNSVFFHTGTGS